MATLEEGFEDSGSDRGTLRGVVAKPFMPQESIGRNHRSNAVVSTVFGLSLLGVSLFIAVIEFTGPYTLSLSAGIGNLVWIAFMGPLSLLLCAYGARLFLQRVPTLITLTEDSLRLRFDHGIEETYPWKALDHFGLDLEREKRLRFNFVGGRCVRLQAAGPNYMTEAELREARAFIIQVLDLEEIALKEKSVAASLVPLLAWPVTFVSGLASSKISELYGGIYETLFIVFLIVIFGTYLAITTRNQRQRSRRCLDKYHARIGMITDVNLDPPADMPPSLPRIQP